MRARKHPPLGFTIVEVMITVAIIGVLASLAIPRYSDHVRRAGLTEAFSRLGDLRIKLEQYYQSHRNYGSNHCGDDGAGNSLDFNANPDANTNTFSITCQLNNVDQAYLLTATGSGVTAGHVYTLDNSNGKLTTQFRGAARSAACWLVRGNEC